MSSHDLHFHRLKRHDGISGHDRGARRDRDARDEPGNRSQHVHALRHSWPPNAEGLDERAQRHDLHARLSVVPETLEVAHVAVDVISLDPAPERFGSGPSPRRRRKARCPAPRSHRLTASPDRAECAESRNDAVWIHVERRNAIRFAVNRSGQDSSPVWGPSRPIRTRARTPREFELPVRPARNRAAPGC